MRSPKGKLYPARFNLFRNQPTSQHYQAVIPFFEQAESRADVKINYRLIQEFVGNDFDFSKVVQIFDVFNRLAITQIAQPGRMLKILGLQLINVGKVICFCNSVVFTIDVDCFVNRK